MNLDVLMNMYEKDSRIFTIVDRILLSKPQHLHLSGLSGSASQFVVSAVFNHSLSLQLNQLVILRDAEEAAYFHNTIENITKALDVFYFPSSFKNKKNYQLLNSSHVMLRTEALTKLSAGGNRKIIVTYPEAIFEKVVLSKTLSENIISFKQGETINVDALLARFVDHGFSRSDFVYEPGQFAVRGGILDIYSYGNEKPYRIELFGNDVDSIRIFDPETQLSERKLLQVNIIPNVETQFVTGEKVSLLNFLPDNTIVWTEDWEFIREIIEEQMEDVDSFINGVKTGREKNIDETEDELNLKKDISVNDFVNASVLEEQIKQRHIVEFGAKPYFSKNAQLKDAEITNINFNTAPQPAFNRNFNLLIDNLKNFEIKKYGLFIFADNPKQLERLHTIFRDLNAEINFTPIPASIHEGYIDNDLKIVCYTDHQIFQRYHKYRVRQAFSKNKALTLKTLRELQPGDYVTHIDHGVGVYSGLQKIEANGRMQEAVRIVYKDNDLLYVNISSLHKISKYSGKEGTVPKMNKLGSDVWNKLKDKTKKQVKDIATDLIKLYAQRKSLKGFAHSPDNYMQTELEASFVYEDTPDQNKAVTDVKNDMEKPSPMDRLVCGDVGFGKTEVAIRAAFKTCLDGKQAAVLVPTTILAYQHYKTFSERLKDFPVTVDYINRFKTSKEKKETLQKVQEGKIDIIIGTHALLGKEVKFKDLGLMVIDEEQKFGVSAKEKLKQIRTTVDSLTLTATPIPRTLQFSLMGARDLSIINTPPPNRQPIQTEVHVFNQDFIRDAIYYETERGGQVFFIHNRVHGLSEMRALLQGLCPDLSIAYAHGQMEGDRLEETILDFMDRKYDVLVCTNIIESGVDIPNVNTIIVNNAHQFGLSDLHQLRGRVGRSNKKAFCYLLAPPMSTLPADSRKRLTTLEQYSDLGSGFQIAMRDLDIRGAGNLLGGEQSGFIAEIGFEMYQKILDEAIRELKRKEFKELFKEEIQKQDDYVSDCTIDTDLEILIPDEYVESITERLSLYSRLDNCENEQDLLDFHKEMIDRFGAIPPQVEDLFTTLRCRKLAVDLGFEKMILKENTLKCFFVANADSPYFNSETFMKILNFIQTQTNKARLKQVGRNGILIVKEINSMEEMYEFLMRMHKTSIKHKTAFTIPE
ncbi:transcription-repair coupling factor [Ginsengibacter hankyongi]|uniref:Transcription-repair-coupling factor n=1 Tax=Ginsengibacter hankyongi TaxID=2607284 RepID=A0A5J5IJZ5_9BACT|nr:transcription-repair coupling factor [Ginsengibacter hankyongi]KAA9039339.1 transcription-repair coupling factor [Ginsengibacter hankyongi]